MTTPVPLDSIADAVDALCNTMDVREPYETWHGNNRRTQWHRYRAPSLLQQLERAAIPGEVYLEETGGGARRTPGSCPPARLDAINLSLSITAWAAHTVWFRCGIVTRETTEANLRALVGAKTDSDTAAQILAELRRWVHSARIIAGWQRPPWRPDAPCPACDAKGLRVRLDTSTAACKECLQTWDRDTIGLLAEHVRKTTLKPVLA